MYTILIIIKNNSNVVIVEIRLVFYLRILRECDVISELISGVGNEEIMMS